MSTDTASSRRAPSASDLRAMTAEQLDETFAAAGVTSLPHGRGRGLALAKTGTAFGRAFTNGVARTSWKGKDFAPDGGSLRNLLGPFGLRAIGAAVFIGDSWADGRPCVVLDYSRTSWVARWVRDEVREVAPGVYLGIVFVRSRRLPLRFVLEF